MTKKRQRAVRLDPDTVAFVRAGVRNRAAMSRKQRADQDRIRVRLDMPAELKALLQRAAGEWDTSSSQLGSWLLAWALLAYFGPDEALHEWLDASSGPSRSLRHVVDLSVESLLESLEDLVAGLSGARGR